MAFINQQVVKASAPLKAAHFPFPRGEKLFEAISWCATDYYTKASSGKPFEARGVLVIGESRQGKSHEILRLRTKFNDGSVIMPDGRPAKIIHCFLSGKITWKDLGVNILELLGYKLKGRRTQAAIWEMVHTYAELQGVVGIHFDECQHVFTEEGYRTNQQILDSFKTLLKEPRWPLMLILSGIPSLATHVAKEEQLARLLRTVHFEKIDLTRQADMDEILQLTFSYAEKAGLDFNPLATSDFFERLAFACCDRWGLVIEMLIEAFTHCQILGDTVCATEHFSHAYAKTYSTPIGYSPFTMPNYRDSFNQDKLMDILKQTR
ncbi:ATP-binding protein [Roseovarius sp. EGI FJ00037]|uniref:ATP-binding protein n=1 Tax=Roseovarius salincola TaxID=2978479 RepID=UPI0022A83F5C|nr:ATP-binding protein [Roseovarius sp. EGI FJ00037]MCZ0813764.1 ATP-binding protein [Roseovarius sp. EGI FJ00037]